MPEWSYEELIVLLFFACIGLVFGFCLNVIGKIRSAGLTNYKVTALDAGLLVLGASGVACIVYGFFEPYRLSVTYNTVHSAKCPAGSSGLRLVHLTDLHCEGFARTEKELIRTVGSLKPDIIVFSGDAANSPGGVEVFKACMREISKIAPSFGVNGNNDLHGVDVFSGTGVQKLDGAGISLTTRHFPLWINGVGADQADKIAMAMASAPKTAEFNVFLYHYPAVILCDKKENIDLICVGHTHGGQVRLPFYGALVTNSQVGKKYEYGMYQVGATNMSVSRGVGTIGLPVRFLAPPEVAVIDIKPVQ